MVIDITFLIVCIIAIFKGYSRGFIIAVFSFLGIIIGLAAAMKLSVVVAGWLQHSTNIGTQWLPFLSFVIVMIAVVLLVRWIAGILRASVKLAMLGWLDKLAGIFLYAAIYIIVYSIVLFYATQMHVIKDETILTSKIYLYIEPLGPKMINSFSIILPFFKNMFQQLQSFFASVATKA